MKKIALMIFLVVSTLSAGLINGVAVIVNEQAITLNELQDKMDKLKVSKEIAIGLLVEEKLYEKELQKLAISVSTFEVEDHIKQIAAANNMDLETFKKAVVGQYGSYEAYTQDVKKNILHSELVSKVARGNLTIAPDEDIKLHYEKNIYKFSIPQSIDVVEYFSTKQNIIAQSLNIISSSKDVTSKNVTLQMATINPELRYMLFNLKEGEVSSILNANNGFVRLQVLRKNNIEVLPMETVKDAIFQEIMTQREQSYLKEYFDKLKISADIVVLR